MIERPYTEKELTPLVAEAVSKRYLAELRRDQLQAMNIILTAGREQAQKLELVVVDRALSWAQDELKIEIGKL